MTSVASQLIEEVTAHAQSDSLEDAREICADGTHFPNNLGIFNYRTNASHKSNPSSVLRGIVDSYSTLPWVTWEAVTFVEGIP